MKFRKFLASLISVSTMLSMMAFNVFADTKAAVAITEQNFPDANFRSYLSSNIDANNNGIIDNSEQNVSIDIGYEYINDFTGIEKLYLVSFKFAGNNLEHLDLSGNPELKVLDINLPQGEKNITELDLSANTNLRDVTLRVLSLTSPIVFGEMPYLKKMNLADYNVTDLKLIAPKIEYLMLYITNVQTIDITACPNLTYFCIQTGFNYSELDISNCPYLCRAYTETPRKLGYSNIYEWKSEDGSETYVYLRISNRATIITMEDVSGVTPPVEEETGVAGFCERLYTCCLGRASEPEGKAYWIDALQNGATGAQAAREFFFCPEFIDGNHSTNEYVKRLYLTFMDRTPSDFELEYWSQLIDDGSIAREDAFWGFIDSPEWIGICEEYEILPGVKPTVNPVVSFATRLYTTCLGRDGETNGIAYWADALRSGNATGRAAAHTFFFGSEFIDGNHSDAEFVARLYRTFMDREGSEAEISYWVSNVEAYGRESVFEGFANSDEFANLCSQAGINP